MSPVSYGTDNEQLTLRFEVEDTRAGIPAEELGELFQAFKQTQVGRESKEGTGLGLRISQKFVQMMGGEITVKSELGKGSCFTFQIQAGLTEEAGGKGASEQGEQALPLCRGAERNMGIKPRPYFGNTSA